MEKALLCSVCPYAYSRNFRRGLGHFFFNSFNTAKFTLSQNESLSQLWRLIPHFEIHSLKRDHFFICFVFLGQMHSLLAVSLEIKKNVLKSFPQHNVIRTIHLKKKVIDPSTQKLRTEISEEIGMAVMYIMTMISFTCVVYLRKCKGARSDLMVYVYKLPEKEED